MYMHTFKRAQALALFLYPGSMILIVEISWKIVEIYDTNYEIMIVIVEKF